MDEFDPLSELGAFDVFSFLDSSPIASPSEPLLPTQPHDHSTFTQQFETSYQQHSLDKEINWCCFYNTDRTKCDECLGRLNERVDKRRKYDDQHRGAGPPLLHDEELLQNNELVTDMREKGAVIPFLK